MNTNICLKIEAEWQHLTGYANTDFHNGAFKEALKSYQLALDKAVQLTHEEKSCSFAEIPYIQIYIISINNLVHTYEELGQYVKCKELLKRVVDYLSYIRQNEITDQLVAGLELRRAQGYYHMMSTRLDQLHKQK
ncbi:MULTISPECIES: hypothetical protein [unclassified Sphingobacterium]|uniref:hypothetical protein n=1 Tax=unclassified Sphingobacterium TaxID=2609468 RepID=UPI0025E21BFD|nr:MULTISPECIES: hypothetical protein [unclassified Sphingobacterium]